jgi:hypothetical protein
MGMRDPMREGDQSTQSKQGLPPKADFAREAGPDEEGVIPSGKGYKVRFRGKVYGTKKGNPFKAKGRAQAELTRLKKKQAKKAADIAKKEEAKEAPEKERRRLAEERESKRTVTKAKVNKPIVTYKKKRIKRTKLPSYTKTKIAKVETAESVAKAQAVAKGKRKGAEAVAKVKREAAALRNKAASMKAKRKKIPVTFSFFTDGKTDPAKAGADLPQKAKAFRSLADKWDRVINNLTKELEFRRANDLTGQKEVMDLLARYNKEGQYFDEAARVAEGNYPESWERGKVKALQQRKRNAKRKAAGLKPIKVEPEKKKKPVKKEKPKAKPKETLVDLVHTGKKIIANPKGEDALFYKTGAMLGKKLKDFANSVRGVIDLGAKLKAMTAVKSASAVRNYYSAISEKEVEGEQIAKRFLETYKKMNDDMSREAQADVVLSLDDRRYFNSLSADRRTEIGPSVDFLRNFFENRRVMLNQRLGKEIGFVQNKLANLQKVHDEARTPQERQSVINLMEMWEDMRNVEFVHIPLQIILERNEIEMQKKNLSEREKASVRKRFNAASQALKTRRVRSINRMLTSKNSPFKKTDFNPVELIMTYQTKYAKDMAMLDIRDAMLDEGIIKPKFNKEGKKTKRPKGFDETLSADFGLLQDHYITPFGKEAVDQVLTVKDTQNAWDKFMAITKMSAFYNPLFLPMYDIYQSTFIAGSLFHEPIKAIPNLAKAVKSSVTRDFDYKLAMSRGLFSKPFNMTWSSWKEQMDLINLSEGETGARAWSKALARVAIRDIKDWKHGSIFKALYHASWHVAWRADETVRMFTYLQLRDSKIIKKMSAEEAAQVAARFHGDYANVPPKTRQKLNRWLFTPTFKLAMGTMYANQIAGSMKTMVGKGSKMEKAYALGAVTMASMTVAFDAMMRSLGWEPEDNKWYNFGRRYTRIVKGEYGMPRQIVFTWSNPGNLVQRYAQRVAKATKKAAAGDTGLSDFMLETFKYELHPLFRTVLDIRANKTASGAPIWNKNDDKVERLFREMGYALNNTIRMTENMDTVLEKLSVGGDKNIFHPELESESRLEAEKWAKSQGLIFDWLTTSWLSVASVYTKSGKDQRFGWDTKRLIKEMKRSQRKYFMQHGKLNKEWLKNGMQKLKEMENEYRKRGE